MARSGLAVHPNYPSARLTLGRALIESGNLTAARTELESVLRGAPDNILASRMLAECLEGLGDLGAALLQFRAALRLNPGDRQIEGQIRALELRLASPAPVHPWHRPRPLRPRVSWTPTLAAKEGPVTAVDSGATSPSLRAAQTLPAAPPPASPGDARGRNRSASATHGHDRAGICGVRFAGPAGGSAGSPSPAEGSRGPSASAGPAATGGG